MDSCGFPYGPQLCEIASGYSSHQLYRCIYHESWLCQLLPTQLTMRHYLVGKSSAFYTRQFGCRWPGSLNFLTERAHVFQYVCAINRPRVPQFLSNFLMQYTMTHPRFPTCPKFQIQIKVNQRAQHKSRQIFIKSPQPQAQEPAVSPGRSRSQFFHGVRVKASF